MPTFKQDIKLGTTMPLIKTDDIDKHAISTDKLADNSVTNRKLAADTLTLDKFDPELRQVINAATGLPDDLITTIQDVDKNLAKLNDTVYPITLGFNVSPDVNAMVSKVDFSVSCDNAPLVPDTLIILKKVNDNSRMESLVSSPAASGSVSTPISGCKEQFSFFVTKQGRTSKSTGTTRYLCYFGGDPASVMTERALSALSKVSATGVSFNPSLTTKDNDYIWLVVPSYLSISRVTSAGFDVTLSAPQTISNSLGSFKAYRTANPLTAATWNLVIS